MCFRIDAILRIHAWGGFRQVRFGRRGRIRDRLWGASIAGAGMGLTLGAGEDPIVWARGPCDMDTESHAYIRVEQPVGGRVVSLPSYAVDRLGNQLRGVFGYGNGVWGRHPAHAAGRRRGDWYSTS